MSPHNYQVIRGRQSLGLPLSGSIVESNPTPTASYLAQNSQAVAGPTTNPSGIPLVDTPLVSSPTAVAAPLSPTSSPSSSGSQIPLGTVIGACIGALLILILAVLLAVYCSKRQKKADERARARNAAANSSRRRSHLEPWSRMPEEDTGEQQMKQRPASGPMEKLGAMFNRTPSTTSGEKSSEQHGRESIGTMQHFAKYHPGLAAEMASQVTITGVDGKIAKPPPAHQYVGRSQNAEPVVSWDEDTSGGDPSFLSLRSRLSGSMSDSLMVTAKSTPAATPSEQHYWHSAEVLHTDGLSSIAESRELRNPFDDNASSAKSSIRVQNPFFNARESPVVTSRVLLPDTNSNPFADTNSITPHDVRVDSVPATSSSAIRSLLDALEIPNSNERIISVQSSQYSRMTEDEGDAISVTAFPYPPTQVPRP